MKRRPTVELSSLIYVKLDLTLWNKKYFMLSLVYPDSFTCCYSACWLLITRNFSMNTSITSCQYREDLLSFVMTYWLCDLTAAVANCSCRYQVLVADSGGSQHQKPAGKPQSIMHSSLTIWLLSPSKTVLSEPSPAVFTWAAGLRRVGEPQAPWRRDITHIYCTLATVNADQCPQQVPLAAMKMCRVK